MPDYTSIATQALKLLDAQPLTEARLQLLCEYMHDNLPDYDWVGFYWNHPEKPRTLKLGAYAGAPTEHTEIPFGKGICGQVAISDDYYLTGDVAAEDNYIACSVATQSELVYPVRRQGELIGQIDIDSHAKERFDSADCEAPRDYL